MKRLPILRPRVLVSFAVCLGCVLAAEAVRADPPWNTREELLCRGESGLGFSYWWGGSCWQANGCSPITSNGTGKCNNCGDGNGCSCCPYNPPDCTSSKAGCCSAGVSCTHSGSYGADCSGFVSRVWQVPNAIEVDSCGHGPYTAAKLRVNGPYWSQITGAEALPGDAVTPSSGHVMLFVSSTTWGDINVYEARGCDYGIVAYHHKPDSNYRYTRRINIGDCTPGNAEQEDCCDCGKRSRTCSSKGQWGEWSACATADPDAGAASCDTGQKGACSQGTAKCVDGCKKCTPLHSATAEVCDGVDNDCNGKVDDGVCSEPQEGGIGAEPIEGGSKPKEAGTGPKPSDGGQADSSASTEGGCGCKVSGNGPASAKVLSLLVCSLVAACRWLTRRRRR